jgi:hypothetical protein
VEEEKERDMLLVFGGFGVVKEERSSIESDALFSFFFLVHPVMHPWF